jgi:hypothetical protein
MSERWRVEIGRVVVRGTPRGTYDAGELNAAVQRAISDGLHAGELPSKRLMISSVRIEAPRIVGGTPAVARTVAGAVLEAARGRVRG